MNLRILLSLVFARLIESAQILTRSHAHDLAS